MKTRWLLLLLFLASASSLSANEPQAPQWTVVTPPAFRKALEPLCEQRRAEGMRVVVVPTTDVPRDKGADGLKDHLARLCGQSKGKSYILLVGAVKTKDTSTSLVPSLRGTAGRMKGQPSDNGFGLIDKNLLPSVAVGRWPVDTAEEVRQLVAKTLAFQRDTSAGPWRNRLTLMVGNPGGNNALEKRFAESFVQATVNNRFDKIAPMWSLRTLVLTETSPFRVPKESVRPVSMRYLEEGQLFSVYLGHSDASGFWTGVDIPFVSREDWAKKHFPGIFFSCGCFGCQIKDGDEGYGLAAMRNPRGPVAVIGAHGESYAALGQFAIDGLLECLNRDQPPERLADYWLAVTRGIATGKMDPITFFLFDHGDGSRGTIPLDVQRREHLEMWMLLGDPALRLPLRLLTIRLETSDIPAAGKMIKVRGSLPVKFPGTMVRLTLERPLNSTAPGLEPVPKDAAEARAVILRNHARANTLELETIESKVVDGQFEGSFKLSDPLPWQRLTIRAIAIAQTDSALGVLTLQIPASKGK
jgi:hypothetical protein